MAGGQAQRMGSERDRVGSRHQASVARMLAADPDHAPTVAWRAFRKAAAMTSSGDAIGASAEVWPEPR